MSLHARWKSELRDLKSTGSLRQLMLPMGVDFCSNDYLGLATVPLQVDSRLSCSGVSSRLLRGHNSILEEVEDCLADFHQVDSVLMFTSGYAANEGVLSTAIRQGDWVASDQLNHSSIIDGLRLSKAERFIYRHCDLNQLEEGLMVQHKTRGTTRELFIVSESLFSMDGDVAPLRELSDLAARYEAHLIIDEAHATGCYGRAGAGLVDREAMRDSLLATIHTGGKALAIPGAYVCVGELLREYLVNRCRHQIFTTAMPPQVARWWTERLDQVRQADRSRERLLDNASHLRSSLQSHDVTIGGSEFIVPVFVGTDFCAIQTQEELQHDGWDVRAVRPPTVPVGTSRLRISVHADHTRSQLDGLVDSIVAAGVKT